MIKYVELDFETRSLADLIEVGAWRYAEDMSTEVLCLVFKVDGSYHSWEPKLGWTTNGPHLRELANDPDVIFVAHGAQFEQAIWQKHMVEIYGFPPLPIERWDCSLSACAWKGLPLGLENAAQAASLVEQKDMAGSNLTVSLSKLKTKKEHNANYPGPHWGTKKAWAATFKQEMKDITPEIMANVVSYCEQDVATESDLVKHVGLISRENATERDIWIIDQKINQRGVRLDMDFVMAAQAVVAQAFARLRAEYTEITGLAKTGSLEPLKAWFASNGLEVPNLKKETLKPYLREEEDGEHSLTSSGLRLPSSVRRVLEIRGMLASTSVKKLWRMSECVSFNERSCGLYQYFAGHSGRWGGRLWQPQNLPRESIRGFSPAEIVEAIKSRDAGLVERTLGLPAITAVSRAIRHAIIPADGKVFVSGDYKAIEAVIDLALAGHDDLARDLANGAPIYMRMAEQIYNKQPGEWTPDDPEIYARYKEIDFVQEYTIGKNTILGCGFQMGAERFHERYCQDQPFEFAQRVVKTYRQKYAYKVPALWDGMEQASLAAMVTGKPTEAYGTVWEKRDGWMTATLPSQWQTLWYPQPEMCTGKFGNAAWNFMRGHRPDEEGQFGKIQMYGGIETENVVQAMARGILCHAMARMERAGLPIVMTTHDEIVVEVDKDEADVLQFKKLMTEPLEWTDRLNIPIAAECKIMERYRK